MPVIMAGMSPPRSPAADLGTDPLRKSIPLTVIAFVIAFQRVIFVCIRRKSIRMEEVLLIIAVFLLIAMTVVNIEAVKNGFGKHVDDIEPNGGNLTKAMYYSYISLILYHAILPLKKLTFLTLYLHLFPYRLIPLLSRITILMVALGGIAFMIPTIFPCLPTSAFYDLVRDMHTKKICIHVDAVAWSWLGFDIATEVWIVLLPWPALSQLQSTKARRVGACILVGLGAAGVAIGVGRTVSLVNSTQAQKTGALTYEAIKVLDWSHAEAAVGLIYACLPSLKQPFQRIWGVGMSFQRSMRSNVTRSSSSRPSIEVHGMKGIHDKNGWADEDTPPLPTKSSALVGERPRGLFAADIQIRGDMKRSTSGTSHTTTGDENEYVMDDQRKIRPAAAEITLSGAKCIDLANASNRITPAIDHSKVVEGKFGYPATTRRDSEAPTSTSFAPPMLSSSRLLTPMNDNRTPCALRLHPAGNRTRPAPYTPIQTDFNLHLEQHQPPQRAYSNSPRPSWDSDDQRTFQTARVTGQPPSPLVSDDKSRDRVAASSPKRTLVSRSSPLPLSPASFSRPRPWKSRSDDLRIECEERKPSLCADSGALSAALTWSSFGGDVEHQQEIGRMLDG